MDSSGSSDSVLPVQYPGTVSRQALVDFCRTHAERLRAELIREQNVLDKNEKTMSDDQYETLVMSQATIMGHIRALRDVTEWAKAQVEEQRERKIS